MADHGMRRVEVEPGFDIPRLGVPWMMGNLSGLLVDIGDRWPKCAEDLTEEVAFGLTLACYTNVIFGIATGRRLDDARP